MLTPREIADEEWLSQCGQRKQQRPWNFQSAPRPGKEPPELDVSMILGRLTPEEAELAAFGPRSSDRRRAVRHVKVRDLRAAGFRVEHTPRLGTPDHVSVFWDGEGLWDVTVSASLNDCCTEGEA
jgi:hypothetical protein